MSKPSLEVWTLPGLPDISDPFEDISIYGQEPNQTTYRLCRINAAIRSIDGSNVRRNVDDSQYERGVQW